MVVTPSDYYSNRTANGYMKRMLLIKNLMNERRPGNVLLVTGIESGIEMRSINVVIMHGVHVDTTRVRTLVSF